MFARWWNGGTRWHGSVAQNGVDESYRFNCFDAAVLRLINGGEQKVTPYVLPSPLKAGISQSNVISVYRNTLSHHLSEARCKLKKKLYSYQPSMVLNTVKPDNSKAAKPLANTPKR